MSTSLRSILLSAPRSRRRDRASVVSPDEMNRHIRTVITAPMTTQRREYPSRVACMFEGKKAEIVLDQLRTVDKTRLIKRLGRISSRSQTQVLEVLAELFAP